MGKTHFNFSEDTLIVLICLRVTPVVSEPVAGLRSAPRDFAGSFRSSYGPNNRLHIETAQVSDKHHAIVGGQISEGRHARCDVATLKVRAQLLGRLFRHARIQGEAGPFGRAARILTMASCTVLSEQLLLTHQWLRAQLLR
jgi:hypothetical protein